MAEKTGKTRRTEIRCVASFFLNEGERITVFIDRKQFEDENYDAFPLVLARIFHYPTCEGSVGFVHDTNKNETIFTCGLCHCGASLKKVVSTVGELKQELLRQQGKKH
ncbi:MAG: hypothetical protein PHT40_02790 [Patescibacteria group bacterium]|nr:hypothetical protein [Patescibacteria group bacterium]